MLIVIFRFNFNKNNFTEP